MSMQDRVNQGKAAREGSTLWMAPYKERQYTKNWRAKF